MPRAETWQWITGLASWYVLPSLTPDILRARRAAHGLIPEDLMKDGSLIFNRDTEKDLLLFLNEDLWTGDSSGD